MKEKNFTLKKEEDKIVLNFEFKILKNCYNFDIDVNLIKSKMTESLMNEILDINKLIKKEINILKNEITYLTKKVVIKSRISRITKYQDINFNHIFAGKYSNQYNSKYSNGFFDMIKYSNGYLAVLNGMKKDYEHFKFHKIFSIIVYNIREVKSSFNFKNRETNKLKYDKD